MCDHGRGLDGRTVAHGRHRWQAVHARLGRRTGVQMGKPTAQIEPKSRVARFWLVWLKSDTCMYRKFGEILTCGFGDTWADRDKQADIQTRCLQYFAHLYWGKVIKLYRLTDWCIDWLELLIDSIDYVHRLSVGGLQVWSTVYGTVWDEYSEVMSSAEASAGARYPCDVADDDARSTVSPWRLSYWRDLFRQWSSACGRPLGQLLRQSS